MKKKDKSKNKIKVVDWKKYRPEDSFSQTDSFYIKLASQVYKQLIPIMDDERNPAWSKECLKDMAIAASSYLEDTISNLGIFKSFREKHKELYGSSVPFYMNRTMTFSLLEDLLYHKECADDYETGEKSDKMCEADEQNYKNDDESVSLCEDEDTFEDELKAFYAYKEDSINFQDILFLVWYITSLHYPKGIIIPDYIDFKFMAHIIFNLLVENYEDAPPNTEYGKVFSRIPIHADPAYLRAFCFQFASGNYLYGPDILQRFESYKNNTKDDAVSSDMPNHTYEYLNKAVFSLKSRSRLLTLDIFEITDRIARYHPFYQPDRFRIDSNSFIFSVFKVLAVNEDWVKLEHVGTGCIIDVVASSFPDMTNIKLHHQIACGVLKKDTYWYFCSIMIALPRDIDTFAVDSEQATAYKCRMDEQAAQSLQSILQSMYKTFIEIYGKNMLFLPRQEAEKVTGAFFAVHNAKLKAEKDCDALQEQDLPNPVFEDIHISDAENVTVYFNPKSGFELYSNIADTIEVEGNPFFAAFSEDVVFKLIYDSDFSTEFCHEIISLLLQKDTLKDSTQYKGLTFDDFDFFKRFCNPDSYKSPPHIFLV